VWSRSADHQVPAETDRDVEEGTVTAVDCDPVRARLALALATAATLALTTACGGTAPTPTATVVRAPEPLPDAPPDPRGRPLLRVTGRIGTTNGGGALSVDAAALDRLGLVTADVNDPWAKQRLGLQGVWLRDLVALARPDPGATTLHLHALDDYQVDLGLADVRSAGILLATRDGRGAALSIEDGGPTRVVFTDDVAARFSPDLWIWNIDTIEVR
jgi:hypothetical protein